MPEFDTSHVKNIVLLGHAGSGKTSLAECMLFEAGIINRRGSISEGNTVGDYHPLEQQRGNSIFSKLMHTRWRGYKINIHDLKQAIKAHERRLQYENQENITEETLAEHEALYEQFTNMETTLQDVNNEFQSFSTSIH